MYFLFYAKKDETICQFVLRFPEMICITLRQWQMQTIPGRLLGRTLSWPQSMFVLGSHTHTFVMNRTLMRSTLIYPYWVNLNGFVPEVSESTCPPILLDTGFGSWQNWVSIFQAIDEKIILRLKWLLARLIRTHTSMVTHRHRRTILYSSLEMRRKTVQMRDTIYPTLESELVEVEAEDIPSAE